MRCALTDLSKQMKTVLFAFVRSVGAVFEENTR